MKNASEVLSLLTERKAWVASHGADAAWGCPELRLGVNECHTKSGWTRREITEVNIPNGTPPDEMHAMLREYWFKKWNHQDAEAEKQAAVDEAKRSKALALWESQEEDNKLAERKRTSEREAQEGLANWQKFGPPGRYGRYKDGSFDTGTDERREALAKVVNFPFSERQDDDTEFSTLALLGTPGTGKTHLAALWLREQVFGQGLDGQFITAAQLVREVRRAWDQRGVDETEVLERFGSIGALAIDDVGVDTSEGAIRLLVEVLDQRLANDLPTCFTSNATATELKAIFGPRGFSRLMANAQAIALTGRDYRLSKPPEMQKETEHDRI